HVRRPDGLPDRVPRPQRRRRPRRRAAFAVLCQLVCPLSGPEGALALVGRARIERPGKDVTITAFSLQVGFALAAAEKLAGEGIDAEVINLRTLRPLDVGTIVESVKKTNRIVSVEEG